MVSLLDRVRESVRLRITLVASVFVLLVTAVGSVITVAAISRWSLMGTSNSPMVLMGSARVIFLLSIVKPLAASASEISALVTEPKS